MSHRPRKRFGQNFLHDQGVIDRVMSVQQIERTPFAEGLASGRIVYCQEEVDAAFRDAVVIE